MKFIGWFFAASVIGCAWLLGVGIFAFACFFVLVPWRLFGPSSSRGIIEKGFRRAGRATITWPIRRANKNA